MNYVRYALFEEDNNFPLGKFPGNISEKRSNDGIYKTVASSPGVMIKGASESGAAPRKPLVTWVEAGDAADARRAGHHLLRVPRMPIRLIPQTDLQAGGAAGSTWGIAEVGAATSRLTGAGVCVAVLDSGIDAGHQAFQGLIRSDNYKDFTGTGLLDSVGHGTHCAGTIFGQTVNGNRIAVAPGITSVLIGKIADRLTTTTTTQLEEALTWAVNQGADIVSLSVGLDFLGHAKQLRDTGLPDEAAQVAALNDYRDYTRFFDRLMGRLFSAGAAGRSALVIAAAGNDSHADGTPPFRVGAMLPATAENVVSVGAVGQAANDRLSVAPFSNTGITLCAPGVGVLSSLPGNSYGARSGTSQAAPHVAGVAALWWQQQRLTQRMPPTPQSVTMQMTGGAATDRFSDADDYSVTGYGLVRAPQN